MKEKRRKDILYIYKHILSLYKSCIKENSKGFSLVSVLVAIGLLGIAGSLGGMDPIIKLMSTRGNLSQKTKLQIQKNILLNHIRNHKIWEQTIDSHTDLKCLKPSTTPPSPKCVHTDINNVPPIPPIPIDILNPSGSKYYESSNPTKGYDENLNPCDGTACPFRWEVTVQLTCPDSVSQCDGKRHQCHS